MKLHLPVPLLAILAVYLALAAGYALATPRWNNPDEPAHYNYIQHLARTGQLPVLQPGDWDSQQLAARLASGRFSTGEPIDAFRYESHQPPLYYLLLAPLARLVEPLGSRGQIVALRSVSIILGALELVVVYAAARVLAPHRPQLAPLAAGLVAFIPMHTAMTAAINNDTLAELLASATLLVILAGLRHGFGWTGAGAVGLLGGALLLTKVTVYLFLPLALLALALEGATPRAAGKPRSWRRAAGQVGLASATALLLGGWWFARNLAVYGAPDLFGLLRHDQVVVGQPRWSGLGEEPIRFFLYSTFRSFWAQFGWMAVVIDPRLYALLLLFTALVVWGFWRFWRTEQASWPTSARLGLRFLLAGLGLVAAEVVGYNLTFIQAQGRYLYPALLAIGVLAALGWCAVGETGTEGKRWARLRLGLAIYWLLATGLEALAWLLTQTPAPLLLHPLAAAAAWLAARQPRRLAGASLSPAPVVALALVDAAALLRFVAPYFQGW